MTTPNLDPHLPDEILARRARHEQPCFSLLYQRHVHPVYAYHLARTGNAHDAQDLTSQTFIAALEMIPTYQGHGSFRAWLLGIARNKLVDHFRARKPASSLEDVAELPHPDASPEESAADRLRFAQVSRAMRSLAPERAEALTLRIFGGLTAAEAGRVMGKSEAAVKMLVHRAMHDLKAILATAVKEAL